MEDKFDRLLAYVGVQPMQPYEIRNEPKLAEIWRIIPHHMRLLMQHVVGALFRLDTSFTLHPQPPSPPP